MIAPEDAQASFGPVFDRFHFTVKGEAGLLHMELAEAASQRGQAHLQMMLNLENGPARITMASKDPADNVVAAALPAGPAKRAMANVNPLVMPTKGGTFVLRLESMDIAVARQWSLGQAKGELELHDVKISSRGDGSDLAGARALAAMVSAIGGDISPSSSIQPMPVKFVMSNGSVSVGPATMEVGTEQIQLSGSSTIEGSLRMKLGIVSPALAAAVPELADKPLELPLVGTVDAPRLDLDAGMAGLAADASGKLRAWVNQQVAAQRSRESDDSQRDRDLKVQEMLKGIATETGTKP
jgi:hypothetical protein